MPTDNTLAKATTNTSSAFLAGIKSLCSHSVYHTEEQQKKLRDKQEKSRTKQEEETKKLYQQAEMADSSRSQSSSRIDYTALSKFLTEDSTSSGDDQRRSNNENQNSSKISSGLYWSNATAGNARRAGITPQGKRIADQDTTAYYCPTPWENK